MRALFLANSALFGKERARMKTWKLLLLALVWCAVSLFL